MDWMLTCCSAIVTPLPVRTPKDVVTIDSPSTPIPEDMSNTPSRHAAVTGISHGISPIRASVEPSNTADRRQPLPSTLSCPAAKKTVENPSSVEESLDILSDPIHNVHPAPVSKYLTAKAKAGSSLVAKTAADGKKPLRVPSARSATVKVEPVDSMLDAEHADSATRDLAKLRQAQFAGKHAPAIPVKGRPAEPSKQETEEAEPKPPRKLANARTTLRVEKEINQRKPATKSKTVVPKSAPIAKESKSAVSAKSTVKTTADPTPISPKPKPRRGRPPKNRTAPAVVREEVTSPKAQSTAPKHVSFKDGVEMVKDQRGHDGHPKTPIVQVKPQFRRSI
jgi:hypothetical protein